MLRARALAGGSFSIPKREVIAVIPRNVGEATAAVKRVEQNGLMECWSNGLMGLEEEMERSDHQLPQRTQYSSAPSLHSIGQCIPVMLWLTEVRRLRRVLCRWICVHGSINWRRLASSPG